MTAVPEDEMLLPDRDSSITAVTVFGDHAFVTRSLRADCEAGVRRFLIALAANEVDPGSVQARVRGKGRILGVQYREVPERTDTRESVRELEAKLESLTDSKTQLKRETVNLELQNRFLESLVSLGQAELPREMVTKFPEITSLAAILAFIREESAKIAGRMAECDARDRELAREIEVTERRLKRERKPGGRTRRCIELIFDSTEGQKLDIDASYVAGNASWTPVYKVDVPEDLSSITMTLFARIEQKTGEDWNDVTMTVSNAVPMRGAVLPAISTWRLTMPAPPPTVAYAAMMAGGAAPAAAGMTRSRGMGAEPETADLDATLDDLGEEAGGAAEAELSVAAARELAQSFEFDLPRRIDIGSGGGETLAPLDSFDPESRFILHCVPARDPSAYLVGRVRPGRALLAGVLNIHFGGRFVGSTELGDKRPGEDLLVNLGADRGLRVERRRITDKLTETFFGKVDRSSVARELEFRIAAENLKDRPVEVEILDAVPVPATDKIQVKGLEMKPEPATKDYQKQEGVMRWEFKLAPGETREISVRMHIKHPRGPRPVGL